MKSIVKKMSRLLVSVICVAAILTGAVAVWAEADESVKEQLINTSVSLTDTIVEMTDEQIESYSQSSDSFTQEAMSSWSTNKEELGAKKEDQSGVGEDEFSESDGTYTVTIHMAFEKANAEFVYVYDSTGTPTSLAVNVEYSMAEMLARAAMNTVMGLGTVFVVLFFLTFVIWLFRFIPNGETKKETKQEPVETVTNDVYVAEPVAETSDDSELIAVIAAAIAASEGTSTDGFVVRSIRKVNRKKW